MSLWWVGVKPSGKMTPFEATKVEAFSPEFERKYGLAFGAFRSRAQAETSIKQNMAYLMEQSEIERSKRSISDENVQKEVKIEINGEKVAKNLSKTVLNPLKTSKPAELSDFPQMSQAISIVFEELSNLKLAIIRAIEALKALKMILEEDEELRQPEDASPGKRSEK